MDKSSKKSDVGDEKALMLFAGKNRIASNDLNAKTVAGRYWYTQKLIRHSYSSIKSALPNHYLKNANIPKTTNGIEGFFSHLKNHLDIHRGLTTKNRMNFIKWYIFLTNQERVFLAINHPKIVQIIFQLSVFYYFFSEGAKSHWYKEPNSLFQ